MQGSDVLRVEPVAGDASSRRYLRLHLADGRTVLRVSYPESLRSRLVVDLAASAWLRDRGLRLPEVIEVDPERGTARLEDLGPEDAEAVLRGLEPGLREEVAARLIRPLEHLARLDPAQLPGWNPPLDRNRLRWELAGWQLWWARHRCRVPPPPEVDRWLDDLAARVAAHPRRVCHRDYHLNNLFLLADGEVGVIDAQDVLVGPDGYDIASVLGERAALELLTPAERERLAEDWAARTWALPGWRERLAETLLQRGLKVLGTFARLAAGGAASYERWLPGLVPEVRRRAEALGAPPALTALLLDS